MLTTLLVSVFALLSPVAGTQRSLQNANYDDIPLIPLVNALLAAPPPKPYKYLEYTNFAVGRSIPDAVALQASSFPNAIFAPYILTGGPLVAPKISAGSKIATFELRSVNSGCYAATENGLVAPAIDCTIRYTGTKTNGEEVYSDFEFTVGEELGVTLEAVQVKKHVFPQPHFSKLTQVKPTILKSAVPNVANATAQMGFDDLVYVATLK